MVEMLKCQRLINFDQNLLGPIQTIGGGRGYDGHLGEELQSVPGDDAERWEGISRVPTEALLESEF